MRIEAESYRDSVMPKKRRREADDPDDMSFNTPDRESRAAATPVAAEKAGRAAAGKSAAVVADKPEDAVAIDRLFSERTVSVFVGRSRVKWTLHENLLSATSDFFRSAFNGGFRETVEDTIALPEDDPAAFELFVRWLYGRSIVPGSGAALLPPPDKGGTVTIQEYLRLYVLACKFLVEDLENSVVDIAHAYYNAGTRRPDIRDVQYVYDNTPPRSGMRRLLSTRVTLGLFKGKQNNPFSEGWRDALNTTEDLAYDIIQEISGWNWVTGGNCPSRVISAACTFHKHERSTACPKK
ncbi:Kelch repeat and BTB domain-containing protein 7 [Pleurostoma richardsiae]|uniref:Kelch repeat and BTB domain-containing protein 7 n=1 Tax=Pleurostoma richardsiae TaxID=41990 RepID=A0AA38R421_9PEZI|nr:Kelch repeat and BTB domain-containing protein 7 [Pleurostoma richardsiae]